MTIDEIKELYKMIAERDDSIGDLISKIAEKDARIIKLENVETTNARLVEDIGIHKALITDLEGELTEIHEQYKRVMEERCAPDEHHCTCVPFLRKRIAELEATVEQMKCCGNCTRFMIDDHHALYCENDVYPFPIFGKCDKWEGR